MTDTHASAAPAVVPVDVAPSAAEQQVKAQVRIGLAVIAGALVGKHILPAGLVNDTLLDALAALVMLALASIWQWARVKLQHSRLWALAINPRVPNDLVRVAGAGTRLLSLFGAQPRTTPFTQGEDPMSLKTFLVTIEDTALAALKAAGHVIEAFIVSETQKLVAEVKQSTLGTVALNLVSALEAHTATGTEKMEMLVAASVPALQKLKDAGGLSGLETSVEAFAKEFGQSVYNDFKAAAAPLVLGAEHALKAG